MLLLSSKTKKHLHLLLGVLLAFLIVDGVAILFGSWITTIIPMHCLKILSAAVFLIFGILMLLPKNDTDETTIKDHNVFYSGFLLILLTEFGDKSQIAAALFAINFNPLLVFIGTMLALTLLSIIAIYCGKILCNKIDQKILMKIGGILFIAMGIATLFL